MTTPSRPSAGKPLPQPDLDEIGIDRVLRALGEPARLRIVQTLAAAEQPMSCGDFDLDVSKSTSTHHFRTLRDSGIITQHEHGASRYSQLRSNDLDERFPGLLPAILVAAPKPPMRK